MKLVVVGFTGTQIGMSEGQKRILFDWLTHPHKNERIVAFHHGDCIGADSEAHDIAVLAGIDVVIHPPDNPQKRAWKESSHICPEKPYLERDRDIVDESDILIAAPKNELQEEIRSGTWYTIRYAWKAGKPVKILSR